jgi:hypothetical protein
MEKANVNTCLIPMIIGNTVSFGIVSWNAMLIFNCPKEILPESANVLRRGKVQKEEKLVNKCALKKTLIFILFIGSAVPGFAQQIELLGIEYSRYPEASVSEADTVAASFHELDFSALVPVPINDRWNLLIGGNYRLVLPENTAQDFETDLFFAALRLVAVYNLSGKSRLILNALPALSASEGSRGLSSGNFLMQGGLFYKKDVSDRFSYTLGVLSTSRFGAPVILPYLGLTHKGKKMRLDAYLPFQVQSMWNYKKPFSYGLSLSVNGSQYNIENQTFNGFSVDVANFSRVRFGPEVQYRIKGPLVITLFGGIALNRTFNFELEGTEDLDFGLEPGPFFSVKIALRPQAKDI